ncbi:MAG: imidazole glycerol phosphate synthase subunit HisH [Bdellovibrionaceae bacterium]|nr:imidazole glycerol phosphate synthase subunit HisH [Pseudobdellovibrionaceae bacterium]
MIVIVDFGLGNLGSIKNMLKKIGVSAQITSDPNLVREANRIVLPGVGHYDQAVLNLTAKDLWPALEFAVCKRAVPTLGVCLGMQLLLEKSEEGHSPGFGWIKGECRKFIFSDKDKFKVPHMGWSFLRISKTDPLFLGLEQEARFYFVHSYYGVLRDTSEVAAWCDYGGEFAAAIIKNNILGVQFHPEKSHRYGMRLLQNFVEWKP